MIFSEKDDKGRHTDLTRVDFGEFHRKEFGFIGAPCNVIQELCERLCSELAPLRAAYADADHKAGDEATPLSFNASAVLTDMIDFRKFEGPGYADRFSRQALLSDFDLVLVNGNHFSTSAQMVIVHPKKLESLERKLNRLNNVKAVLLFSENESLPDFLQAHLDATNQNPPKVHYYRIEDLAAIIRRECKAPEVKGLVLAGGKSSRMGRDKTLFRYQGKPHREFLLESLESLGIASWLSCREDQLDSIPPGIRTIADSFTGLGPYGAILSAFRSDPNAAWLVLAADLPLMDKEGIRELLNARNPGMVATAFRSPVFGFPEPLVSLWEPRAYFRLLYFLSLGYSCPRKVLINTPTEIIEASRPEILSNVNTPEDLDKLGIQEN